MILHDKEIERLTNHAVEIYSAGKEIGQEMELDSLFTHAFLKGFETAILEFGFDNNDEEPTGEQNQAALDLRNHQYTTVPLAPTTFEVKTLEETQIHDLTIIAKNVFSTLNPAEHGSSFSCFIAGYIQARQYALETFGFFEGELADLLSDSHRKRYHLED